MSFTKRVKERYSVVAMSMKEAAEQLGLNLRKVDFAIPQDFFNDMHKLFPGRHWAGVWSYEDNNMLGSPRPLTDEAQKMLRKFNTHFDTSYEADYKVING